MPSDIFIVFTTWLDHLLSLMPTLFLNHHGIINVIIFLNECLLLHCIMLGEYTNFIQSIQYCWPICLFPSDIMLVLFPVFWLGWIGGHTQMLRSYSWFRSDPWWYSTGFKEVSVIVAVQKASALSVLLFLQPSKATMKNMCIDCFGV